MSIGECSDMCVYALSQRRNGAKLNVVAAFKHTHNPSFAELVGDFLKVLSQPLVVEFAYRSVTVTVDVVKLMCVEASRAKDDVWFEFNKSWEHFFCELLAPLLGCHLAYCYWYVENAPRVNLIDCLSVFNNVARTWIKSAFIL